MRAIELLYVRRPAAAGTCISLPAHVYQCEPSLLHVVSSAVGRKERCTIRFSLIDGDKLGLSRFRVSTLFDRQTQFKYHRKPRQNRRLPCHFGLLSADKVRKPTAWARDDIKSP